MAALAVLPVSSVFAASAAPVRIVYPAPEAGSDSRGSYIIELLRLALDKSGAAYELAPYKFPMEQSRVLLQLEKGGDIDVAWSMTTREREKTLRPIRIPIDKGLLGWRLLLINNRDRDAFGAVHSLPQLQAYAAGQEHDWPDVAVLRANGLKVKTGETYDGLFHMLEADRFQYFPRSVTEIWDEQERHRGLGIEVETTLALHYPSCIYFFVKKDNLPLEKRTEQGLRLAIRDGSFDKLFQRYYGNNILRAGLRKRTVLELANPLLPGETPVDESGLWFKP
ncbi:MAG TPA: hypothetical protein VF472_04365 [Burkholderiaceae bacterium]